jgi:cytochrome c5
MPRNSRIYLQLKGTYYYIANGGYLMSISATHYRTLFTLVLVLLLGTSCSDQGSTPAPESSQPAAKQKTEVIEQQVSAPAEVASVDGQKIYKTYCQACHANGVAGSPKFGDKAAWAPRIAKGNDALFLSVKKGLKAMPPKGACMACSDDDLRAAMGYIVEQGSN